MNTPKQQAIKELSTIPGVGKSIAADLWDIGITSIPELKGKNPETLYVLSNTFAGTMQDRCLLYVFKCAVYYADTPKDKHEPDKLKWWYWKNK
jgi:hypothetical protein